MSTARGTEPRQATLLWFGVFGAPVAWFVQHIAGFALTEAECGDRARPGTDVHLDTWTLVVGGVAALVAVASGLAAVVIWRATRGLDDAAPPPSGRVHFLAVIGMTVAPLFLIMILMSSLGVVSLDGCLQE